MNRQRKRWIQYLLVGEGSLPLNSKVHTKLILNWQNCAEFKGRHQGNQSHVTPESLWQWRLLVTIITGSNLSTNFYLKHLPSQFWRRIFYKRYLQDSKWLYLNELFCHQTWKWPFLLPTKIRLTGLNYQLFLSLKNILKKEGCWNFLGQLQT